jgi:hypothetical protein
MKQSRQITATTYVDKHGDKLTLSALESIVNQVNLYSIPVGTEHDPRIPPHGRIHSAKIIKLEDGEYALETVFDIFEHPDDFKMSEFPKELPPRKFDFDKFHMNYDRSYSDVNDQALIQDICDIFGTDPKKQLKKAVDPLSVLTIVAFFVLGNITRGFLNKLGVDAYILMKDSLKRLMNREKSRTDENLLKLELVVQTDQQTIEVDVILTNPTSDEIDKFFDKEFNKLDDLISIYHNPDLNLRRLTFEYKNGELKLNFAIRKDGVPLTPINKN